MRNYASSIELTGRFISTIHFFYFMFCHICLTEIKDSNSLDKLDLCKDCFKKVSDIINEKS